MQLTRESVMDQVRSIIAEYGSATVGAGQRPEAISAALNYAFEPTNGREMSLRQRGLTDSDLNELRSLGGTTDAKTKNSMGGTNRQREIFRRLSAMKDARHDAAAENY